MENQLNENNLQLAFNFNPSSGSLTKNRIIGEILIEESNKRIAIQESSDKIAIDLGYSIDGDTEDMEFTINLEKLLIKTVCQRWELVECAIKENEIVIVRDEPSFKTCLWLNKSNIGKTLNYKIISQNTSISSWMLDIIARKLNKFNIQDIASLEENIKNINTSISTLNDQVTELQNNSGSGGGTIPEIDNTGYSILRHKNLIWRAKTTDYGSYEGWYGLYSDVKITRYSDGTAILTAGLEIYRNQLAEAEIGASIIACIGCPIKFGKIHSLYFSDKIEPYDNIIDFKMSVTIVEDVENVATNDPKYGGFDIKIKNLANYTLSNINDFARPLGSKYYMNILFDLPESYITNYDYIL